MNNNYTVSVSPHLRTRESTAKIMWMVTISLLPAGIAGIYMFGKNAALVILSSIFSAIISEAIIQKLTHKKITITDGSAFLTGLLLAYNLPAQTPLWLPIIGSLFAIAIGKHAFGGLGYNIFNPALVGRAFLMSSWPAHMTYFTQPLQRFDAITCATPLALIKEAKEVAVSKWDLFLGMRAGCIGEVCILALIIGAAFLLWKGYIQWYIPVSFIFATALLTFIFGGKALFSGDWLFHILSGGLILGAFFMATDYVTSPLTARGQLIFGLGCGILTAVIRLWGGYPEGVSYAILIMNAATPLIDRYTNKRIFGT